MSRRESFGSCAIPDRVVDASVVGALVFGEPRAAEAHSLMTGNRLFAPRLITYELTNIAWQKILGDPARREAIVRRLQRGLALNLLLRDVSHPSVCRLALDENLTTYDASYLYLHRALGLPLLTFDRRLAAAAGR